MKHPRPTRDYFLRNTFQESYEAMEALADILMDQAVQQMNAIANEIQNETESPISKARRLKACMKLVRDRFEDSWGRAPIRPSKEQQMK